MDNCFVMLGIFAVTFFLNGGEGASTVSWRDEAVSSADKLSVGVEDIMGNLLGYNNFQDYYDTLWFTRHGLDGNEILDEMANDFGQKIFDRNNAVKHLKDIVEDSLTKSEVLVECCGMTTGDLEYDDRFKQPIGSGGCYRKSELTRQVFGHLTNKFQEACAENLQRMPFLRWQYFASESGITSLYPAVKVDDCDSYDARFRPFYVQANVPEPKDVVVVIDQSSSMRALSGGRTLMEIAKEAAKTVVSTLNPHDRVAVLGFSTNVKVMGTTNSKEACFREQLAQATQENADSLHQFIEEMRALGGTNYGDPLAKAFDYFENTEALGERERVILFLSDGEPQDSAGYIFGVLKEKNAQFNDTVFVMTYGMGDNLDDSLLRNMAQQNYAAYGIEHPEPESVARGVFTYVSDPTNLREEMGSYYSFFSERTTKSDDDEIWSLPYLDKWGIGLLMSVSLPVHDSAGRVVGVVGTDLTLDDFLSSAVYFRASESSYIFVIDAYGFVIYHPLFKYPEDHEVKYIDISAFETEPEMADVISDMKRGGSGSKTFPSQRVAPGGSSKLYGVKTFYVTTEAHWKKIPHSAFSVCVMLTKGDEEVTLPDVEPRASDEFLYHRFDIVAPKNPCKHYDNYCAMNQSMVSLGPRAFVNTDAYLSGDETADSIDAITKHMMSGLGGSQIKPNIRASVWATQEAERFWKSHSDSNLEKYVMWRYIGTKEGIIRMYPGSQLPKDYDPTVRPWYRNAVANKGKATFTSPYLDAASGQFIMSISKVIYEGNRNSEHDPLADEVVAVMAVDIQVPYFEEMLRKTFPICFQKDSQGRSQVYSYRCTVVDSAGFVMFGNTADPRSGTPEHITQVEPLVAESLLANDIMVPSECMVMEENLVQKTYKITTTEECFRNEGSAHERDCTPYQFIPVRGTNIYVIVRADDSHCTNRRSKCVCSSFASDNRKCILTSSTCECPCTATYESYNTCQNKYIFTQIDQFPKACTPAPKPLMEVGQNERDIGHLPSCSKYSYNAENDDAKSAESSSVAIIAGAVAGGVVLLVIIVGLIVYFKKGKRERVQRNPSHPLPRLPSAPEIPSYQPPPYDSSIYANVAAIDPGKYK